LKVYLDCFPCFLKQALECSGLSTDDQNVQKQILDSVMNTLISIDYKSNPPYIARDVYAQIRNITGNSDPYCGIRDKDNKEMIKVYEEIRSRILKDDNALYLACKLATGGNIIDSGAGKRKESYGIEDLNKLLSKRPAIDDFKDLKNDLEASSSLLYLGDNSGEIVMDKLFIETIKNRYPDLGIYYGVRGRPVINDVTEKDASDIGLDKICSVISNGDSSPGTIIEYCSDEFKSYFNNADLIISKGQGNYETLSDIKNKKIYFLLFTKCPVIADHIGVDVGSLVIQKGNK